MNVLMPKPAHHVCFSCTPFVAVACSVQTEVNVCGVPDFCSAQSGGSCSCCTHSGSRCQLIKKNEQVQFARITGLLLTISLRALETRLMCVWVAHPQKTQRNMLSSHRPTSIAWRYVRYSCMRRNPQRPGTPGSKQHPQPPRIQSSGAASHGDSFFLTVYITMHASAGCRSVQGWAG
jgi:hypothetical protein